MNAEPLLELIAVRPVQAGVSFIFKPCALNQNHREASEDESPLLIYLEFRAPSVVVRRFCLAVIPHLNLNFGSKELQTFAFWRRDPSGPPA